ncbi:protein CNPPD1 [Culicoides brevitarsis]|uniref:protein CNPPD1 n=1 Tax=Culicoides brevitarsis TaxID=469753 RepID=UPI00307C2613
MRNSKLETKVVEHQDFLKRIKKTLYYGASPASYQCDRISRPLADYTAEMFSETHKGTSLNRLDFVTVSKLKVTPCSLILAMIYLDRLNSRDPDYVRKITPSELFLVSMMVSTKFYCGYDEDIYISAWAEYGNMTSDRLKELELDFLDAMEWEIYASNYEFFEKLKHVEYVLAKRQGTKRGWLTYTELAQLLPSFAIAKHIINCSTILALSYVAGVVTIFSGFFVASHVPGTSLSAQKTSVTTNSSLLQGDTDATSSDLTSETEETELDYIMEDLNESIEMYDDDEVECRNSTNSPQMLTHWLLQNKCSPTSGVNNGILLRNYLDDNGHAKDANYEKNRTSWSSWAELLVKSLSQYKVAQNHDKENFDTARLVPAIWMKFI